MKKTEQKWGKLYQQLFNLRDECDYYDFAEFQEEEVEPLLKEVENFIQIIEKELLT